MAERAPMAGVEGEAALGNRPVIIVRRGMVERFVVLAENLVPDGVLVLWDRRVAERRRRWLPPPAQVERRARERGGAPPPSWALLDFLLAWPTAPSG
jgi:hypothetical protein